MSDVAILHPRAAKRRKRRLSPVQKWIVGILPWIALYALAFLCQLASEIFELFHDLFAKAHYRLERWIDRR